MGDEGGSPPRRPEGSPPRRPSPEQSRRRLHAVLMAEDEGVSFDNSTKGAMAAQSFSSLMSLQGGSGRQTTATERQALRSKIQEQSFRYREQIRRQRRCTLDPHSRTIQRWDALTVLCLCFTATVTPFEVGLLELSRLEDMAVEPLAWINRMVDVVFVVDILLQCFITYQESTELGSSWVHDNRKILIRYAKSWLGLDLITALPIDLILASSIHTPDASDAPSNVSSALTSASTSSEALQLVRMLRLVKLGRVLRCAAGIESSKAD